MVGDGETAKQPLYKFLEAERAALAHASVLNSEINGKKLTHHVTSKNETMRSKKALRDLF